MGELISAEDPALRLLAQSAGIAPSKLAAATNDPDHFLNYITVEDISRYGTSVKRVLMVATQIDKIFTAALKKAAKGRRS